jgi:hypothetical protein
MKNRIILGIFAVVFCFFLAGCEFNVGKKEYSVNGINVTLEDGLVETDIVSQTVYLKGIDMEFTALKESFTDLEKVNITNENSLEDYARLVVSNNKLDSEVINKDGVTYFEYVKEMNGKNIYYLATVNKSEDAFWLIQFICSEKNKDKYKPKFLEWSKTVSFDKTSN